MIEFLDLNGEEISVECIGCDVHKHTYLPPGGIVYENEYVTVIADPEIPMPGLMILEINRHVQRIEELAADEILSLADTLVELKKIYREADIAENCRYYLKERSMHFHIWIIPEYDWIKVHGNDIDGIVDKAYQLRGANTLSEIVEIAEIFKEKMNK